MESCELSERLPTGQAADVSTRARRLEAEKAYAAGYQAASDYFGAVVSYSDPVPYPANMIPVPQT